MINIQALTVGPFQSNCYIVSCSATSDAVIFDAGDEAGRILAAVADSGVNVKAVVNTHAHLDHVGGLAEVVDALGVPVFMHPDEDPIYDAVPAQAAMFGLPVPRLVVISGPLATGEKIHIGELTGEVLLTPGHSPGSVCIAFYDESPPRLIAGDTLFAGSIGRTDLPGGDHDTMMATLKNQFVPLPEDMIVYPGHGPETTIGHEKQTNMFLAPLAR